MKTEMKQSKFSAGGAATPTDEVLVERDEAFENMLAWMSMNAPYNHMMTLKARLAALSVSTPPEAEARCLVTGNPVGTDTRQVGYPCRCANCTASPLPPETREGVRPAGHVSIAHDGFAGDIIGHYETREGKRGVVVQQDGTRVVHVYGEKWLAGVSAAIRARGQS